MSNTCFPCTTRLLWVPTMLTTLLVAFFLFGAAPCTAQDTPQAGKGQRSQLVLSDSTGKELLTVPMDEGDEFAIRYIHSVAKSPVEDWFSVEGSTIFLEKTVYQDFGAGLPHEVDEGQVMDFGNGHISISGFHRPLPTFDQRVGRIANHTLLLEQDDGKKREIPLNTLVRPGQAITFAARPIQ